MKENVVSENKTKNILLINHYAGSTEMGMEFRPYYFAREWIKLGHNVDIIAGDFSHLRKVNPEVQYDFQTENIDGINYHWIKTGTYNGNGIKRALTMFRFVFKLWLHAGKIVKEMQPDVVIASSTYPLDTYAGQRIRKKSSKKIKLIHEVHDMWPATLVEIGGMSKWNPFVVAIQIAENSAYKNSDHVISLAPYAEEYMKKHGLKENSFTCIPNGTVEEDWQNPQPLPEKHEKLLEEYKACGKFIVGYFGGHALSNRLSFLIDVAANIEDRDVQFVLVGDGVEKENLQAIVDEKKLNNVTFLEPINKLAIPTLCDMFDCIYIGGKNSTLYRFGLAANKMHDSMRAGKPIILSLTVPQTYIEEFGCGLKSDGEDLQNTICNILKIKNMTLEERRKIGENGKRAAKKYFTYDKLAEDFISVMQE